MLETLKSILSEYSGVGVKAITSDMYLEDDLYIEESDLDEVLNEIEDQLGFEFEERNTKLVYVSDLIMFVKAAV